MRNVMMTMLAAVAIAGCTGAQAPRAGETTMARKLAAQVDDKIATEQVAYVARFGTLSEAEAHAKLVKANGGTTKSLNRDGTILTVTVERRALDTLSVGEDAIASVNTEVRINRPAHLETESRPGSEQDILEALTVRSVTGVDRLVERFPEADGRGVKVAVFDTGIDFGVEGVSTGTKLDGFYDLTGFGKVQVTELTDAAPQATYTIGGLTVALPAALGMTSVKSTGVLSESALARAYDMAEGVDLNGNGEFADSFPFMIAIGPRGDLTALIDVDGNSAIAADGTESLGDYNTTKQWIDMYRTPQAPSGARPLAVTLTSSADVQFHSVPGGHGTSCAVIIAGDGYADGRLIGLAPKATLTSYMLDADGQDFYTMDQLLAMFVHAKEDGVDAISISWGFATADLQSARFLADFLDREIASAGIVVGIAAGNEGPGYYSAVSDDYIPRHGFGVAALLSEVQATNVYGWTGATGDAIVWYSAVGPTRGGRMIPDASSPIVSFVRGQRGNAPGPFYGFSGTSSATPALVGSVAALMSVLKQHGEESIEPRLIKLAVQASARKLSGEDPLRQGAGVIDVAAAYDVYRRLAAELRAARADTSHRTKFAYELKPSTPIAGQATPGEGIIARGGVEDQVVSVSIVGESSTLVDPLVTVEPLIISHSSNFLVTPRVLALQATGGRFAVQFNREQMQVPGLYTDVIELARPDGVVLLRIPVAITIDGSPTSEGKLAIVDRELAPFQTWSTPILLTTAEEIVFDGVALDLGGNNNHSLYLQVYNELGHGVAAKSVPLDGAATPVSFKTGRLPAGRYELTINRNFSRPAALGELKVTGAVKLARARLVAAGLDATGVDVAIALRGRIDAVRAALELTGTQQALTLDRGIGSLGREGYLATVELSAPSSSIDLTLRQSAIDVALEGFLNVELVLRDHETGAPLYRGWYDMKSEGAGPATIDLIQPSAAIDVLAYPNIVDWSSIATQRLTGTVGEPLAAPVTLEVANLVTTGTGNRTLALRFEGEASAGSIGVLRLYGADGTILEQMDVTLP
jgi:hypothetical protein